MTFSEHQTELGLKLTGDSGSQNLTQGGLTAMRENKRKDGRETYQNMY